MPLLSGSEGERQLALHREADEQRQAGTLHRFVADTPEQLRAAIAAEDGPDPMNGDDAAATP